MAPQHGGSGSGTREIGTHGACSALPASNSAIPDQEGTGLPAPGTLPMSLSDAPIYVYL
jgi:hypothetical protein